MTQQPEILKSKYPIISFNPASDQGNAVISPDEQVGDAPYFTLIGSGTDEQQNALAEALVRSWNASQPQAPSDVEGLDELEGLVKATNAKLPWRLDENGNILDADGFQVCGPYGTDYTETDALIVAAVNSISTLRALSGEREVLRASMQRIQTLSEPCVRIERPRHNLDDVNALARSALKGSDR